MARILVVDDEENVLHSMKLLMQSEKHEVVLANRSDEALSKIAEEDFDLVITDIRMAPMDGMELIMMLHAKKPDLPVIVVSACNSAETVKKGLELGATAYLPKPFKVADVISAVNKALKKKKKKKA